MLWVEVVDLFIRNEIQCNDEINKEVLQYLLHSLPTCNVFSKITRQYKNNTFIMEIKYDKNLKKNLNK